MSLVAPFFGTRCTWCTVYIILLRKTNAEHTRNVRRWWPTDERWRCIRTSDASCDRGIECYTATATSVLAPARHPRCVSFSEWRTRDRSSRVSWTQPSHLTHAAYSSQLPLVYRQSFCSLEVHSSPILYTASYSINIRLVLSCRFSRVSITIIRVCVFVILCVILAVCPNYKTKKAETKITKLGTGIIHHDSSLTNKVKRSKFKVTGDRVDGVSYVLYGVPSL